MSTCPACQPLHVTEHPSGINPQGTTPDCIWQMDVTHFPVFGLSSYIHLTIDTFFGFSTSSLLTGEKAGYVI